MRPYPAGIIIVRYTDFGLAMFGQKDTETE